MAPVTTIELDPSQRTAAHAEPAVRQVVLSGPGSGKTEVVAALVGHLVTEHELDPDGGLLVISFSRAAVRAVGRRLRSADVPASAAVRTLDALAAQIVVEATGRDVAGMSFDARVAAATRAVHDGLWDGATEIRHLVVDEVQDVVGLRADFLLALVEALDDGAGFTLLGDPAQAIYDFQLRSTRDTTGSDLLERVADSSQVRTVPLTGSYRALTRDARAAVALRDGAAADLDDAYRGVRDFVEDLVPLENLDDLLPLLSTTGTTAVLSATNGEALLLAHELWDRGVPAVVRRPATEPVIDRWVATVLTGRPTWSRDEFIAAHDDDEIARARWKALRTVARAPGAAIDTRRVASALSARRGLPAELVADDEAGIVVSTVHRAKGLEFDTVVLAQHPPREDDERDDDQRTRLLYVAVTRARARIFRLPRRPAYNLRTGRHADRWLRTGRSGKGTTRFELRGADMDRSEPPGDASAGEVHRHLATRVRSGDPLVLTLDASRSSLEIPVYTVIHEDVALGRTSADFGRAFAREIGTAAGRRDPTALPWPGIAGAHVECVETVAGEPQRHRTDGVGRDGLWLGVRPVGLPQLVWRRE